MKAIHVTIRQIGNSQGVVIPKPFLVQLGLTSEAGAETTIGGPSPVDAPISTKKASGLSSNDVAPPGDARMTT